MSAGTHQDEGSQDATSVDRKPAAETSKVDPRLLEILVCPLSGDILKYDAARQELVSPRAGLAYPIRDGIPIMLPEEARVLEV